MGSHTAAFWFVRTPNFSPLCAGKTGRGVRKKGIRTPKVPLLPLWGLGGMLTGEGCWGSPCVPSSVSGIRTPKLPLLPLWEKGVGGMLTGGGFLGKPLCAIFRFRHQDTQTPPFPLVGEGGWGEEGQTRLEMQNSTNRLVTPRECAFRRRSAHRRQAGRAQSRVALSSRCSDPAAPVSAPYRSMQRPYRE
jgi:hypothetical protein